MISHFENLKPRNKHYHIVQNKKLSLNYVQSHRAFLNHKSDKIKIGHYVQSKEAINRSQSQIQILLPNTKADANRDLIYNKHLREQKVNNEFIKQTRLLHSHQYFKRITKFTSRQMRNLLVKETVDGKQQISKSVEPLYSEDVIKDSDLVKIVRKLKEKAAHKFIVMRYKRWKQQIERDCCLEYFDSLISQQSNLSIIDWLSKKNIQ